MKKNFPFSKELELLFDALLEKGDELRVVGGCVRDFFSGRKAYDIDLACTYLPEETVKLLKKNRIRAIPTGIKHGTITALINNKHFEITTLRKDVKTDGRRAEVEFVDDFYLDAKRRDFTINAMSIDLAGEVYDYFGGIKDLENHIVRFIGDAQERIEEDYLRILRFFRFSCYYAKDLNQDGLSACIKSKDQIKTLSKERIRDELLKILNCPDTNQILKILSTIKENSILDIALESSSYNLGSIERLFKIEQELGRKLSNMVKFSALIYGKEKQHLETSKKLRLSNKEQNYIKEITNFDSNLSLNMSKHQLIEMLFKYDKEIISDKLVLQLSCEKQNQINKRTIEKLIEIEKTAQNTNLPKFPINGNDLLEIKISPKEIGVLLDKAKKYWIGNDFKPNRHQIIEFIKD